MKNSIGAMKNSIEAMQNSIGALQNSIETMQNNIGAMQLSIGAMQHSIVIMLTCTMIFLCNIRSRLNGKPFVRSKTVPGLNREHGFPTGSVYHHANRLAYRSARAPCRGLQAVGGKVVPIFYGFNAIPEICPPFPFIFCPILSTLVPLTFQKNILVTYSAQIIAVLSAFLCSIMAARMLGAAGQGQLALFTQFALLASMAMSFGLPPALVHFVASGKIAKDQVMSLILTVTLIGFVLLIPALLFIHAIHFFFPVLPDFMSTGLSWSGFVLLYLLLVLGNSFFTALLQAEHRFVRAGSIQVISSMVLLSAYAWRFFAAPGSVTDTLDWIVCAMGVSQAIQWLAQCISIVKQYPAYVHLHVASMKVLNPMMNFAFLAYSTNLIQFLSYKIDTWLVNYFHGNQPTGIYALAASLAQMIWLLPAAVQSVLFSFLSTHFDRNLDRQKTLATTRQLGAYALVAAFAGYFLSMYAVPAWFGDAFSPAVNLIGILLLGMAPFCLTMPISAYFASRGRLQTNLVSAVIGFVVCLAADLILIPRYGMYGAAWASVLSYLSTLFFFLWMFFRKAEPR